MVGTDQSDTEGSQTEGSQTGGGLECQSDADCPSEFEQWECKQGECLPPGISDCEDPGCAPGYVCEADECVPGDDGTGSTGSWPPEPEPAPSLPNCEEPFAAASTALTPTGDIMALAFIDAHGAGMEHLLVSGDTGLELHDPSGELAAESLGIDLVATQIAVGDLDGDGFEDFMTADDGSGGRLSILVNDGAGGFSLAHEQTGLGTLESLSLLDYDGNQHLDVVASQGGRPAVFLSDDAGVLQAPAVFDASEDELSGLVAADFDGDGRDDVAAAPYLPNAPVIEIWNGAPTVATEPSTVLSASYEGGLSLAAGTFAGLDTPRLVAADLTTEGSRLLLWQADSVEVVAYDIEPGIRRGVLPRTADFDGDGELDALFGGAETLVILHGASAGSDTVFSCVSTLGTEHIVRLMDVGDVDGDGQPEIATSDRTGLTIWTRP